jgi:hypothetical protein
VSWHWFGTIRVAVAEPPWTFRRANLGTSTTKVLVHDGYEIVEVDAISGAPIFDYRLIGSGVRGSMKNLIFAAVGPKPEIVLDDAVNKRPAHHPQRTGLPGLRPAPGHTCLNWAELNAWWADHQGMAGVPPREVFLDQSLDNEAERRILRAYPTDRCASDHTSQH